jgi:hypothetical protein
MVSSSRSSAPIPSGGCGEYKNTFSRTPLEQINRTSLSCTQPLFSFVSEESHGCRDDVKVSFCNCSMAVARSSAKETKALPRSDAVNLCVPVLRGFVNADWLRSFAHWYSKLGVSHMTIYVMELPSLQQRQAISGNDFIEWIDVSWLNEYESWQQGQLWSMHDCLYRSRAKFGWGLFVDIDELLHFSAGSLPTLLVHLEKNRMHAATFGSVPYVFSECSPQQSFEALEERMVYRALKPECSDPSASSDLCIGHVGRRKLLVKLNSVKRLQIHTVVGGAKNTENINASDVWLKHLRGAPFRNTSNYCNHDVGCKRYVFTSAMPDGRNRSQVALMVKCERNVVGEHEFYNERLAFSTSATNRSMSVLPDTS